MPSHFRAGLPVVPAALPEAQEDPDGVQPEPAPQARASLREEPVRGGRREEAARPGSQSLRDSGENIGHYHNR